MCTSSPRYVSAPVQFFWTLLVQSAYDRRLSDETKGEVRDGVVLSTFHSFRHSRPVRSDIVSCAEMHTVAQKRKAIQFRLDPHLTSVATQGIFLKNMFLQLVRLYVQHLRGFRKSTRFCGSVHDTAVVE